MEQSRPVPWVPYTFEELVSITACVETGMKAEKGRCPVHGGDACLRVYTQAVWNG